MIDVDDALSDEGDAETAAGSNDPAATKRRKLGINLTDKDFQRITESDGWFSTEMVDAIMVMLKERNTRLVEAGHLDIRTCHFFSHTVHSFVCRNDCLQRVQKWTVEPQYMHGFDSANKAFLPMLINGNHWVIAVLYPSEHRIEYYDSMRKPNDEDVETERLLSPLLAFLAAVRPPREGSNWRWVRPPCPQQLDTWSCGLFVGLLAYHISSSRSVEELLSVTIDKDYVRRQMHTWLNEVRIRSLRVTHT